MLFACTPELAPWKITEDAIVSHCWVAMLSWMPSKAGARADWIGLSFSCITRRQIHSSQPIKLQRRSVVLNPDASAHSVISRQQIEKLRELLLLSGVRHNV